MVIINEQKEKYTLLIGRHMSGGVIYDANEKESGRNIIELTREQAERLGMDRLRKMTAQEGGEKTDKSDGNDKDKNNGDSKDDNVDETQAKFTSLLAGNLQEVETEVKKIDNVNDLNALAKLETEGKQRAGVMKLLRERREELK